MTKRLFWMLPLLAIMGGALSSLVFYRSTNDLLTSLGTIDSPSLSAAQALIFDVKTLADGIKGAVAAADKDALHVATQRADAFRDHVHQFGTVPGQADEAVRIQQLFDTYIRAAMTVAGILLDGRAGDVGEAAQAMQAALSALDGHLQQCKDAAQQHLNQHIDASRELAHQGLIASIGASLLILALSLWASRMKVRTLMQQLGGAPEEAARIVQRIAGGDLSKPVQLHAHTHGSLLHAMRDMQAHLAHVIGDVHSAVSAVRRASGEISSGNQDLATRSARQASHLQASAASVEQLTASVRHNAESAEQARLLATQASDRADAGSQAVAHAVSTMSEVSDRARKIVEITSLIDGIAFQTNILALNAAVEAARAGEQGRGFSVVAGEVRVLAQRAGAASKEIKALIEDSAHRIEQGARHVNAAGLAMDDLVQSVRSVGEHIAQISLASAQQRDGIELVNRAVAELDASTHENHALVEQAGQAAQSLHDVAHQLGEAVGQFQLAHH